eukprot:scaffold77840_cov69-Phaeocystis_antarctica.AAC.4
MASPLNTSLSLQLDRPVQPLAPLRVRAALVPRLRVDYDRDLSHPPFRHPARGQMRVRGVRDALLLSVRLRLVCKGTVLVVLEVERVLLCSAVVATVNAAVGRLATWASELSRLRFRPVQSLAICHRLSDQSFTGILPVAAAYALRPERFLAMCGCDAIEDTVQAGHADGRFRCVARACGTRKHLGGTQRQAEWRLLGLGVARLHAVPLFQQLGADDLKVAILHPVVVNVNDHVVKLHNKGGGERIHHEIDARLGRREQHER